MSKMAFWFSLTKWQKLIIFIIGRGQDWSSNLWRLASCMRRSARSFKFQFWTFNFLISTFSCQLSTFIFKFQLCFVSLFVAAKGVWKFYLSQDSNPDPLGRESTIIQMCYKQRLKVGHSRWVLTRVFHKNTFLKKIMAEPTTHQPWG